jgi:hypothetical protein
MKPKNFGYVYGRRFKIVIEEYGNYLLLCVYACLFFSISIFKTHVLTYFAGRGEVG